MKQKLEYKVEDGVLFSRERPKEEKEDIGPCSFCHEPVFANGGQLVKHRNGEPTHKKCR